MAMKLVTKQSKRALLTNYDNESIKEYEKSMQYWQIVLFVLWTFYK